MYYNKEFVHQVGKKRLSLYYDARSTKYKKKSTGFGIQKWNFRSVKSIQIALWLFGLCVVQWVISEIVWNESLIIGNRCDSLWRVVLYITNQW